MGMNRLIWLYSMPLQLYKPVDHTHSSFPCPEKCSTPLVHFFPSSTVYSLHQSLSTLHRSLHHCESLHPSIRSTHGSLNPILDLLAPLPAPKPSTSTDTHRSTRSARRSLNLLSQLNSLSLVSLTPQETSDPHPKSNPP